MKDRVFQLAVLLVLVIGISVGVSSISRGDDEIAPTDQTVQEQDINRWVPLKIKMTGAVLGRTPSLSLTAIGESSEDVCSENAEGECLIRTFGYTGSNALALMRAVNTMDLSSMNLVERFFKRLASDGRIGSGTFAVRSVQCDEECAVPTPTPGVCPGGICPPPPGEECNPVFCDGYYWSLDAPEAKVEKPVRKVRLDQIQFIFGAQFGERGYPAAITGTAAKVTDGEVCASELRQVEVGDGEEEIVEGCGLFEFGISDRATVAEVLSNDGTSKRMRRKILEEGQGAGLPSGTVSGDPL